MTSFRDRVNSHLPILLQVISTLSLAVLAASALCGSQSLKKLVTAHELSSSENAHVTHIKEGAHNH